jgi:hypothetical protein
VLNPGTLTNKVERGVLKSFPDLTQLGAESPSIVVQQESFAETISHALFEKILHISPVAVRERMVLFPGVVKKFLVCDVNTVMYCSEFRYSLFSSAVVVAVVTYITCLVLSTIGVPYVWTLAGFVYVPLVFFYSFGISPLCAPMIPTCLGNEILKFLDLIIPEKITWPQALQQTANCIDNPEISAGDCIVTCEEEPFLYVDWVEPLAWGFCDISLTACTAVERWLATSEFMPAIQQLKSLTEALQRSANVLSGTDEDMKTAFRLCASLTSWKSIPVLLLIGFAMYTIPVLVMLPFQLLTSVLQLGVGSVLMTHLRWTE